jgi:anthranilate synthase component II
VGQEGLRLLISGLKTLILDNYDSFTYNLVHYVEQFCVDLTVRRNDAITLDEVGLFDAIILSPGPGLPKDAGIMPELLLRYAPSKRMLGVCLGHQAIGEAFGAQLRNLDRVLHGVAVPVRVLDSAEPMFLGLPEEFPTGRYHSWVIDRATLPDVLKVTATDAQGEVMALSHRHYDVSGVQFHPESLLTPHGLEMVRNWVNS